MAPTLTTLFQQPLYPYWRVKANGKWHLVKQYTFHYREGRSSNVTFCDLGLDNPPFMDLFPFGSNPFEMQPEPEPACQTCRDRQP